MAVSRRQFFVDFGRVLIESLAKPRRAPRPIGVRPPGALPEPEFLKRCTRCTDCLEACPYDAISRLGAKYGGLEGTPIIVVEETPCYLCEDMPCIAVCEPESLTPISRAQVRMGTAELNERACYLSQGEPCDYCVSKCPLGEKAISLGAGGIPEIHGAGCAGCGVCAYLCPPSALTIIPDALCTVVWEDGP
jgi:ferredoxin-type protein NapG